MLGRIVKILSIIFKNIKSTKEEIMTEPKIAMEEEKFKFMVCGEPKDVQIEVRKEMSEKDAIGKYPYTISTARAIYEIRHSFDSQGRDVTAEYGTSYTMSTKSK